MRREIYDKLIIDLEALQFASSSNLLFTDVRKGLGANVPMEPGIAVLLPDMHTIEVMGNTYDARQLGFALYYRENVEADEQTEVDLKLDRLSNIEDVLYDYLEQEPNALAGEVGSLNIFKIRTQPCIYDYSRIESGYAITQTTRFSVYIEVTPQLL